MRTPGRLWIRCGIVLLCVLAGDTSAQSEPRIEQRVVYADQPVSLSLTLGHEHRIVFPEPVYIDLPQRLARATASLQPDEQVVYLTGRESVPPQRLIATATSGDRVYLVDIQVVEDGPRNDYRIESPELARTAHRDGAQPQEGGATNSTNSQPRNPPQIELLRYASQSLYAPARLQPVHAQIRQAPTPEYPDGVALMRSTRGETFDYRVVAAWRGFGRYITAVELINVTDLLVELDPRQVQGAFDAAAFQHTWLDKAGTAEDRTTLYLISDNPFPVSAQGVGYGR